MHVVRRWRLRAERLAWRLDQPHVLLMALWMVPLVFGLLAVKLGQDYNYDLKNYHLYNAFAFLNGKVGVDLAPAQLQTYFNPTIDLLYYGLVKVLPGPVAGFVMGALQGLNFVLLTLIGRMLLPPKGAQRRILLPLLLALAGMGSNAFISEFGNTMGDNLTALAVLGSLAILLRAWPRLLGSVALAPLLAAGAVMGIGVGLKLTVAVFALGLCLSLFALPLPFVGRVRAAFLFGLGVLVGLAAAGGHWYWKMWTLFGNPLFPQFGKVFPSLLAAPISLSDTRFLPHGLAEYLFWPAITALDPLRISEIKVANPIWLVLFAGGTALALKVLLRRRSASAVSQDSRVHVAAAFVTLSYGIWMCLFSIGRYLVPIELLAPLMLWLLAQALLPRKVAGKVVGVLLLAIIASNFPRKDWGYAPWADTSFRAETPVFADPAQSMVLMVQHDTPTGWLVPMFPKELAFAALGSSFPESPAYRARIAAMIAARNGPLYAMMETGGAEANAAFDAAKKARIKAYDGRQLIAAMNVVARYDLVLEPATCFERPAYMGKRAFYYVLCQVRRAGA